MMAGIISLCALLRVRTDYGCKSFVPGICGRLEQSNHIIIIRLAEGTWAGCMIRAESYLLHVLKQSVEHSWLSCTNLATNISICNINRHSVQCKKAIGTESKSYSPKSSDLSLKHLSDLLIFESLSFSMSWMNLSINLLNNSLKHFLEPIIRQIYWQAPKHFSGSITEQIYSSTEVLSCG